MGLQDEPLLEGQLLFPPQGMLGQLKVRIHRVRRSTIDTLRKRFYPRFSDNTVLFFLFSILFLQKTWQKKFCQIFNASKYGIERLEIFDSQEEVLSQQHSPRILTLEACVKIAPSNQPRVFAVSRDRQRSLLCQEL